MKIKAITGTLLIIGSYCLGVAAPFIAQHSVNPGNTNTVYKAITTVGLLITVVGINTLITGAMETQKDNDAFEREQSKKAD